MMRRFRVLGGVVFVSVMLSITASPALTKPPAKPSAPTDLVLSASRSGSTVAVNATWVAGTNATGYAVKLKGRGLTLDSATVSTLTWTGHATRLDDGATVTVSVTSYNKHRRGATATRSLVLPDMTAPTASYVVTHDPAPDGPTVTVAVNSLADNLTPTADISQVIDWGDGATPEPWSFSQATISHTYPDTEARYEAQVTLADQSSNNRLYPLAIVVKDRTAPTGTFALITPSAWAGWTKVRLAQQGAIQDNLSPADQIIRVISWGDGAQTIWTQETPPTHVYDAPGSYSPTVTLTDEAGNSSEPLATSTVVVKADKARPTIRLTPPRTRETRVTSWRTLKGRAADAQTGVRTVVLKTIAKRGKVWYAYKANTRSWVKAKSKAAAWKRTVAASVRPTRGNWSVKLSHVRKGLLLYKARAFDNRANASFWVSKRAQLTRR